MAEPILDFLIVGLPDDAPDPTEDPTVERKLEQIAYEQLMMQYPRKGSRPPRMLIIHTIEWVFTSDPEVVKQVQPGDGCPACIAGNDQALAALTERPEQRLALGNVTYTEVW